VDLKLQDRLAFVSASTAGIGLTIAGALAREGARVIVNGRTPVTVAAAVERLRAQTGIEVLGFAGDMTTARDAEALADRFPDVEILVANLGVVEARPFEDIPDADWLNVFEANVLSSVRLARLYLPTMRAAHFGRIIFISSASALQLPRTIHDDITKSAQIALARGLAAAVAGTGVTVNCVLAGPTRARGVEDVVQAFKGEGEGFEAFETVFVKDARPPSPINQGATPEEVASLVAYVASPIASATTGAALRVDSGVAAI